MPFHSIEFYVISAVVAAAVIAVMARPPRRVPARTRLIEPDLTARIEGNDIPHLVINCDSAANLTVRRTGIRGAGDVKISVTIVGHDILIEESAIPAAGSAVTPELTATFGIDSVGRDRYHLSYTAPHQSLFTSLQFTVRPGIHIEKTMTVS